MRRDAHLKIEKFGSEYSGVRLHGDPKRPEVEQFGIKFPGGQIYVARCSDGTYWAHIETEYDDIECRFKGEIVAVRQDLDNESQLTTHIAARIKREGSEE